MNSTKFKPLRRQEQKKIIQKIINVNKEIELLKTTTKSEQEKIKKNV